MQILIDTSVLVTLIETYFPIGVYFNDCHVAQRGLRWSLWDKKGKIEFDVICRNGLWGGSCSVASSSWGYGSPITRECCKYPTLQECIDIMWTRFETAVRLRDLEKSYRIDTKTPWFSKAECIYKQWLTLSPEEQLSKFEEVHFYGQE